MVTERQVCPYCDELVDIEYKYEDYHKSREYETFAKVSCPKCKKIIELDWENCDVIHARRKE